MKTFALLVFIVLPALSFAQALGFGKKLTEYKASNGRTYHIGDTIKLAQGSAPNGTFRYVQYGGWLTFFQNDEGADTHNLERGMSGYGAVIKKIHSFKAHGIDKIVIAVSIGVGTNCDLWIEDAIESCEIIDCKGNKVQATIVTQSDDQFDKLKKLKALLDSGAITKTEYDEQKKKLLKQ
ncbi:MAG: SHOCT domain-containing protein [Flavisolibacter sp.]